MDTTLAPASITAHKQSVAIEKLASPSSVINLRDIQNQGISRHNSLNGLVPGLHIPDYGAAMTSTIYVRGFGSRMENPSIGLYIDDIPVLDKNAYDFDWDGIRSATFLRGPQGTLYGRNSMCGVLSLRTLTSSVQKWFKGYAEFGSGSSLRLGVSNGFGNNFISASFRRGSGWFTNATTGDKCDPYTGGQFKWKWNKNVSDKTVVTNTLHLSYSDEGGFAYGKYENGALMPVSYNDEGTYRRLSVLDGFKLHHTGNKALLDAVVSVQLLGDRMRMDQDFTPEPVFTLEQKQRSGAATLELTARPAKKYAHWRPQTGFFSFIKANRMNAPVVFKEAGVNSLILDNANRNIPSSFGHLDMEETQFPVKSDFDIYTWNAALYHESVFSFGRWLLTAGMRLDYEGGRMDYDSNSLIHYKFVPTMAAFKAFNTAYKGTIDRSSLQALPKVSALYDLPLSGVNHHLAIYGNIAKGIRAGGFNTQIFSDILQARMMNGVMEDLGVHLDNPAPSVGAEHTVYDPEQAWNYELGLRYIRGYRFKAEVNSYYIDGRNQQLTVFPAGKSTGRMMTNAGKSMSYGVEAELDWQPGSLHTHLSYSWCRARFVDYNDGNATYNGNRVPYVPEHTVYACADYWFTLFGRLIKVVADLRGAGPFTWNESNTLSEPFSLTLGGQISFSTNNYEVYLRGENLTGHQARTFYFKSVGNEFFALAKPRRVFLGINIYL